MGTLTDSGAGLLEWAWAGSALDGVASGDVHVVAGFADGALVGVIDGLGHGVEAAAAASEAARVLAAHAGEPLDALVARCHEALRGTRGAVMTVATLDARAGRMTWAGVGNVEAILSRAGGDGARREAIALQGGIVGYRLPTLRASTVPLATGDVLTMATDGIRAGFAELVSPRASAGELADAILARYARGTDDALVVVARIVGGRPPGAVPSPGGAP
jgi:serine/threonine protein phosphatase PrpC